MTGCDATRRLLHAYVDGELVGAERAELERHVVSCAACAAGLRAESAMHAALGRASRQAAPRALRDRVDRLLTAEGRRSHGQRRTRVVFLAAAAAAGLALLSLLVLAPRQAPRRENAAGAVAPFARAAADAHLRHAAGQLPLEVVSEQPDDIAAWFAGKLEFSLALPRYPEGEERRPYRLRGGRLVSYGADYAAFVAYEIDSRPMSLLVTTATRARPGGQEAVPFGRITFYQQPVAGLNVLNWSDRGLTYALVSDLHATGERSCLVCHGTPEERRRIEGFEVRRQTLGRTSPWPVG